MHVISHKRLVEFGEEFGDAIGPLDRWYTIAKKATWANFSELRSDFQTADQVGHYTIFDIGGNQYRLVTDIYFEDQVLLIRGVFTHRDYDKLDFS
jgi:mRNA interferase HigB